MSICIRFDGTEMENEATWAFAGVPRIDWERVLGEWIGACFPRETEPRESRESCVCGRASTEDASARSGGAIGHACAPISLRDENFDLAGGPQHDASARIATPPRSSPLITLATHLLMNSAQPTNQPNSSITASTSPPPPPPPMRRAARRGAASAAAATAAALRSLPTMLPPPTRTFPLLLVLVLVMVMVGPSAPHGPPPTAAASAPGDVSRHRSMRQHRWQSAGEPLGATAIDGDWDDLGRVLTHHAPRRLLVQDVAVAAAELVQEQQRSKQRLEQQQQQPQPPLGGTSSSSSSVGANATMAAARAGIAADGPTAAQQQEQPRSIRLPGHVYLISFVLLLSLMLLLLSCHCWRLCRLARRMEVSFLQVRVRVSVFVCCCCRRHAAWVVVVVVAVVFVVFGFAVVCLWCHLLFLLNESLAPKPTHLPPTHLSTTHTQAEPSAAAGVPHAVPVKRATPDVVIDALPVTTFRALAALEATRKRVRAGARSSAGQPSDACSDVSAVVDQHCDPPSSCVDVEGEEPCAVCFEDFGTEQPVKQLPCGERGAPLTFVLLRRPGLGEGRFD